MKGLDLQIGNGSCLGRGDIILGGIGILAWICILSSIDIGKSRHIDSLSRGVCRSVLNWSRRCLGRLILSLDTCGSIGISLDTGDKSISLCFRLGICGGTHGTHGHVVGDDAGHDDDQGDQRGSQQGADPEEPEL